MLHDSAKSPDASLPYFPVGLPDETIGSRISRYHILRGQPTTQATYRELFNRTPFSSNGMVHPHLDKLAKKLPGSATHNLTGLQNDSTLGPLFQRFSGSRVTHSDNLDWNDAGSGGRPRRIRGDSRLTHLCPQCLCDDELALGSPYIHRSHQIPGVTACWRHGAKLLDRCPSCRCPFARPNQLILSAWLGCACGTSIAAHAKTELAVPSAVEKEFSQFAQQLLESAQIDLTTDQLVDVYKQRALELGYCWGTQRVNRKALFAHLEEFFGADQLARMDHAYRTGKISGWFHLLTPRSSNETPMNRHLIFAFFLFRDAATFLARSADAAASAALQRSERSTGDVAVQPAGAEETSPDDPGEKLLAELIDAARRYGYDTQQLWQHHFSAMTRLVKIMPSASTLLDALIKKAAESRERKSLEAIKSRERLRQADLNWANEIAALAPKIQWEAVRPVKVTKHRLIEGCSKNRQSWPEQSMFPLTCVAIAQRAESIWHFYARRMLWTLQALHDPLTPQHKIIIISGLEVNKARAILEFFADAVRGGGPSIEVIKAILKARGIATDWKGPCPEQEFYSAGRGYKLRTSRWGPIGGKVGEAPK